MQFDFNVGSIGNRSNRSFPPEQKTNGRMPFLLGKIAGNIRTLHDCPKIFVSSDTRVPNPQLQLSVNKTIASREGLFLVTKN